MAELFLARDSERDELIVIKRILPYLSQEPEFVQMFLDEARIAAQLHHPNIVTLHELGALEGSIFIAMEFLDGVDLRKLLQEEMKANQAVPYSIAAFITARVCEGLDYAHNRIGLDGRPLEIIHRDVSPQNVMVGYDGRVKLVDFGIAKANAFMERSKPGVIKGKFLYLAPEQLSHERADHRADLFAVGTMLYETTTGKSPFYKNTTEAVILAIRSEDPPPPHLVVPNYPLELSRIVMRCLTKDRNRRYQQGAEIARDLDKFIASTQPTNQAVIAGYVDSVFGDEAERTVLHIPGQALPRPQTRPTAPPVARKATAESRSTAPGIGEDEDLRTQMARPVDLKKARGEPLPPPVMTPPPQRRASMAYVPAGAPGAQELELTSTHTGAGGAEEPSLTPSTGADRPSARRSAYDDRGPVFDPPPLSAEPRTREEGPRAKSRGSGSKAPPPSAHFEDDDDDESTVDFGTLSTGGSQLTPTRRVPRRIVFGAVAAGVMIIVAAAAVRAFRETPADVAAMAQTQPAVTPERPEPPPAVDAPERAEAPAAEPPAAQAQAPTEAPKPEAPTAAQAADEPGPATARAVTKRPVIFRAPYGTKITAGSLRFAAEKTYRLTPGTLAVRYDCPRGRGPSGSKTFVVEDRRRTQVFKIPCRR